MAKPDKISDVHLIVAERVTQNPTDNDSLLLLPIAAQVAGRSGQLPDQLVATRGFFSNANLERFEAQQIDAYVPGVQVGLRA